MTSSSSPSLERGLDTMILVYSALQGHPAAVPCQQFLAAHSGWFTSPFEKGPARSALKVFVHEPDYRREGDVYLRLQELAIGAINDCEVPQLLGHDRLWVVQRPFLLDFAGAYLDRTPDFSDEVLADWRAEKANQFGERWPDVQVILRALEAHGIFLLDVHPGNISWDS